MSDWDPELYNRFRHYRGEPVTMMLERLHLGGAERIVDLGCGTGEHTVELARRSPKGHALGIDSSPAMIQRARKLRETLEPELRARLDFELSDFRNFKAERRYTVVFSNAALQWINDHRTMFTACYRSLGPGGRLAIQMPANEHETAQATMRMMALEPAWSALLSTVKSPSDENVLTPARYHQMLSAIGFGDIECFYHAFQHPMRNAGEVVEFCRATSLRRFLEPLTTALRSDFVTEFTRRLEESYGTRGELIFSFRRLFLLGRRLDP